MSISIFGRAGRKRHGRPHTPARMHRSEETNERRMPDEGSLRLLSLNIAHARRKAQHQSLLRDSTIRRNLELIAGVLERERPDVVALQEADGPSFWSGRFDHVAELAGLAGFPHAFRGEHNREVLSRLDLSYGTALLSRLPLEAAHSQAFSQNWRDTKGFVTATVASAATFCSFSSSWHAISATSTAPTNPEIAVPTPFRPAALPATPPISAIRWVSELVGIAGGDDIFPQRAAAPLGRDRIVADLQEVVDAAPDLIIGSWCGKKFRPEKVATRAGWAEVPAVRDGELHEIKSPLILQPGPAALTDGLDALHAIVSRWSLRSAAPPRTGRSS